jgi:hypothetical protein
MWWSQSILTGTSRSALARRDDAIAQYQKDVEYVAPVAGEEVTKEGKKKKKKKRFSPQSWTEDEKEEMDA